MGEGTSSSAAAALLLPWTRCGGSRADDGELPAVDELERKVARIGEDEQRAARREGPDRFVRAGGSTEDNRVDRTVGRPPGAARVAVDGEHVVAAAGKHGGEQVAHEAMSHDQHAPTGDMLRAAQDTCQRLDGRPPRIVEPFRQPDPALGSRALGEPPGHDRLRRELLARRLVSRAAARAVPAWAVVDESDSLPVRRLPDDLVAEHPPRVGRVELLEVGTAQPTGEHVHELAAACRLVDLGEPGLARCP